MDAFLARPDAEKVRIYIEAQAKLNLPAEYIEKDVWVCWCLRELFTLPGWGDKLTFKGGTSLSKAYQLIDRFSEDIDVTIGRKALGFEDPIEGTSRTQTKKALAGLKEKSVQCVREQLLPAIRESVLRKVPGTTEESVMLDPDAEDGQSILFGYPSVFSNPAGYVKRSVKLEFGARADTWPSKEPQISCYVAQAFPRLFQNAGFAVRTLVAERTFWEKAMLLHEWTYIMENGKELRSRQARHYYDLWCMINKGVGDSAAADLALFESIREHRRVFFESSKVDYDAMRPGSMRIAPLESQRAAWETDYAQMNEMFLGDAPPFADVLETVKSFELRFNED
jgi:hypothetical protein